MIHVKQNNVVSFPEQPIDIDRVCLHREEPCTILILPVVTIERLEPASSWVGRLLDAATKPPV